LFSKALATAADAISLDLEDAVVEVRKPEARAAVSDWLRTAAPAASGKIIIVRVNAIDSAHFEADVQAVALAGVHVINLPKLHAALAGRTALEWEACFGDEVPCAAARSIEDMFDFPQVQAEAMVSDFAHPTLGSYKGLTRAITFGRTPGPEPFAAPMLDQHGAAIKAAVDRLDKAD
jgi:citrate lyase beta subunit